MTKLIMRRFLPDKSVESKASRHKCYIFSELFRLREKIVVSSI